MWRYRETEGEDDACVSARESERMMHGERGALVRKVKRKVKQRGKNVLAGRRTTMYIYICARVYLVWRLNSKGYLITRGI